MFAPCPAVCCFGACAGDVPILSLRCTRRFVFVTKKCATHTNLFIN